LTPRTQRVRAKLNGIGVDWPFKKSYLPDKGNLPVGTEVQFVNKANALEVYEKIKTQAAISSYELKRRKNLKKPNTSAQKMSVAYSPRKDD
jgi:hypothetical protein